MSLEVSDLRKSFTTPNGDRLDVLRGISLTADAGETVAIIGPSGSGKSTLLHLLAGLEEPDHGRIVIDEFDLTGAEWALSVRFRRQNIGLVFQFHHLLRDLTAIENVMLPMLIQRTDPGEANARAIVLLELMRLGDRVSYLVSDLSGGEQQRVALCRALVTNPKLVLADEPTGNVDNTAGEVITQALLTHAKRNHACVIIATHSASVAERCDRRLVLAEGKITAIN